MSKEAEALPASVRVKELDWRSLMDETFIAETVLGIYRIEDDGALFTNDRFRLFLAPNVNKAQKHASLAAAKAVAQIDFECRILSALSLPAIDLLDLIERAMPPVAAIPEPSSFEDGWFRGVLKYRRNLDEAASVLAPKPKVEERV